MAPGECVGDTCEYPHEDETCDLGCVDATCVVEGEGVTIQSLQNPADPNFQPEGSLVQVKGVVVTAPNDLHGFWVSEPEGGPWSGVFVFVGNLGNLPPLALGDVVDLVGTMAEYHGHTQLTVTSVVVTGAGSLPEPVLVTPSRICNSGDENLSCGDGADAEMYEGVYLRMDTLEVANADFGLGDWTATTEGSDDEVLVEDRFVDARLFVPETGFVFQSITGVLDYSHDYYRLAPTRCADLLDVSGQAVCEEVLCPEEPVSIMQIRDRSRTDAVSEGCPVRIEGAVVTAVMNDWEGFAQDPTATAWAGLYLFCPDGDLAGLSEGDVLDLDGVYTEFVNMSLVEVPGGGVVKVGTASLPEPVLDVDYVLWGNTLSASDKTGIDTYLPDTPINEQDIVSSTTHAYGESYQRVDMNEGTETASAGNGIIGHDETFEDLSQTWTVGVTSPGLLYAE